MRGEVIAQTARELRAGDAQGPARNVSGVGVTLVDQLPLELARHHGGPRLAQLAALGVVRPASPAIDVGKQRPLGQHEVAVQVLQRITPEQELDGRAKHLAQLEVDPAHRPVEIHLVIEVEPRVEKHVQRFRGVRVQRQAPLRDEGIVNDPLHVHRAGRHPTYIGIARDVVHVVSREWANQGGPQYREPGRRLKSFQLARRDEVGDPAGIDPFARFEISRR